MAKKIAATFNLRDTDLYDNIDNAYNTNDMK